MSVYPPSQPLTRIVNAAGSRGISDENIFTKKFDIIQPDLNNTYTYINVNNGLLYYYVASNSRLYIIDNETFFNFPLDNTYPGHDVHVRVVKYYGQYYFYYVSRAGWAGTLKRYNPDTETVIDTGLLSYHGEGSDIRLYDSRLEIVNDLLLFGTAFTDDYDKSGKLYCIQSNHTVLRSHSDSPMNSWSSFIQHGQNLIICDAVSGNTIIYKPVSQLGLSGGWISIGLPSPNHKVKTLQLVNGEIFAVFHLSIPNYYEVYRLSTNYATWSQIGQSIMGGDRNNADTIYGEVKYIGINLYLFPTYGTDYIFKLVNNIWVTLDHPTAGSSYKMMLESTEYTMDKTFKQRGKDLYILSKIKYRGEGESDRRVTKIDASSFLTVFPDNNHMADTPAINDSELMDRKSYIVQGSNLLETDGSGNVVKRDLTLSRDISESILSINYYYGRVYASYSSGRITRANLVTPDVVASTLSVDVSSSVFKRILTDVTTPTTVPLANVDARNIINKEDITRAGGNIADYASVKMLALSAPDANPPYPSFEPVSSDLNNALVYIPFNSGGVVIKIGGVNYTFVFDSTLAVPTLTVNGDPVPFGSRFTLSNVTFRFLSRGSITLATNQPNTFPLRLGSGLYNCYADTIIYTKQTIYNLRDGKTLPTEQGRFLAGTRNILQDLGETVNIFTLSVGAGGRVTRRLRFVFRLVQVVNGGAATEGVSGAPVDDYLSGFVCTWAESGRPAGNLT